MVKIKSNPGSVFSVWPANRKAAIIILSLFFSLFSPAQENIKLTTGHFSLTGGILSGGPGKEMNQALDDAGRNGNLTIRKSISWSVEASESIKRLLDIGINVSNSSEELYSEPFKACSFNALNFSPFASISYKNIISIGAGPSASVISYYWNADTYASNTDFTELNFGFLLKSAIQYPGSKRFYARFEFQYRWTEKIDATFTWMGPYIRRYYTAENINMNYLYLGIGAGINLFEKNSSDPGRFDSPDRARFVVSGGFGLPEALNIKISYGKNLRIGAGIGFFPGEPGSEQVTGGLYYHFMGKSRYTKEKPWYAAALLVYYKPDTYLGPRFGRTFNLTKRIGIDADFGAIVPLTEALTDAIVYIYPSGSLGFFIRL